MGTTQLVVGSVQRYADPELAAEILPKVAACRVPELGCRR
jgi:hypothetical protein